MPELITKAAPEQTPDSSVIKETTAFFNRAEIPPPVRLTQYDNLPYIAVHLVEGDEDYTVPDGAAVNIRMKKPDGTWVYNPAYGLSTDRHTAYIECTTQMTAVPGQCAPIIEVVVDGQQAGTAYLHFDVDRNPVQEDDVQSTDEGKTIQQLAQEAKDAADAAAASEDAAVDSATAAAKSATAAANSASAAKSSQTAAASSASAAASSASAAKTSENNAKSSATNAASSASAAASSASAAKTSETNAKSSQTAAASSASAAASSASAAKTSENNAKSSATNAASSASTATSKASAAATSATNAANSASTATSKASEAATSATQAAGSATNAAGSASAAAQSAADAQEYAEQAQQVSQGAVGYYETAAALRAAHPTGQAGNWAIVGETDTIWVWDTDTNAWMDTSQNVNLSDYYTKTQADARFAPLNKVRVWQVAVPASAWTGSGTNYTAAITVSGMTAALNVVACALGSSYVGTDAAEQAMAQWDYLETGANTVTFHAAVKPTADFGVVLTTVS